MVRRSSSRFRPQEPTVSNVAPTNEHNHNDAASDIGSDIMTVSDIHTITNEHEVAALQQHHHHYHHQKSLNQQNLDLLTGTPTNYYSSNNPDAAGGIGTYNVYSPSDIRTIDNDNASIISDLQHTVGTAGGGNHDDIHTVTGTVTGSVLRLSSSPNGDDANGNVGSTVILGVSANDMAQPTTKTTATDASLDNSFWSRARRTLGILPPTVPNVATQPSTDCDAYYDEGRPVPFLDSSGAVNGKNSSTPPPAVIVTSRRGNDNGNIDFLQPDEANGGDSYSNTMIASTSSVWKQRLCGLRADRLILLLMFVLLAAVGVIVGAIVVSQQQNESRSSAASSAENDRPGDAADEPTMITLTRTPTTPGPTTSPTPTVAPLTNTTRQICENNITLVDDMKATFPVLGKLSSNGTIQYTGCKWVANQTAEQIDTLCDPDTVAYELCRLTCENCNELPMSQKKAWPIDLCGSDSPDQSFDAGMNQGMGNCLWLSKSLFDIDRLCQPGNDAYDLCRETCRNCGPGLTPPTQLPSATPFSVPSTAPSITNVNSEVPSVAPIPLSLAPVLSMETTTPSVGPSSSPVAATAAPITATPVTDAPMTAAPVTPVDTLAGVIVSASPESSDRLSMRDSTQSQALEWLRSALDVGTFGAVVSDARTVQIWTLATLAFNLGLSETWLTNGGNDECLWDGIICSADTRTVVGIDLEGRAISGSLPPEISLLSGLIGLNLSTNNISGELPNNFGSTFQNLQDLRFDRNNFSGTLPSTIGMMSALRIWYMERNPTITGTLPSTVAQLSSLEEFVLYYTDISGVVTQGICDLRSGSLGVLNLDCTKITFDGDPCWTKCLYLCGGDTGVPCSN